MGKHAGFQTTGKSIAITTERGILRTAPDIEVPILPTLGVGYIHTVPNKEIYFDMDIRMLSKIRDLEWDVSKLDNASELDVGEWRTDIQDIIDLKPKIISFDTETTGLTWYKPEVVPITLQMAYKDRNGEIKAVTSCVHKGYAEKHNMLEFTSEVIDKLILQWKQLLEDPTVKKVAHNFKYDHHLASKLGINVTGWYQCTMQLSFVCDDNMTSRSLAECIKRWVPIYGGYDDKFSKEVDKSKMMDLEPDRMEWYGCADAYVTYLLAQELVKEGMSDKKNWNAHEKCHMPALLAFANVIEKNGMRINTEKAAQLKNEMQDRKNTLQNEMYSILPQKIKDKYLKNEKTINLNSSHVVGDILFGKEGFKLTPQVYTKGTQGLKSKKDKVPATGRDHLLYFTDNDFVVKLLEYKKLEKMISTYLGDEAEDTGIFQYIHEGKIRPSYFLSGTVTGRCLSGNTEIYTHHGYLSLTEVIKRMEVGEYFQVYTHEKRWRSIKSFYRCGNQNILKITLDTGKYVECSYKHRFLTKEGDWRNARKLKVDDVVVTLDTSNTFNKCLTVGKIVSIEEKVPERTYDIEVEQDHSFFANSFCSHNSNSKDPNGQNFPKRGALAKAYRAIFEPTPGYVFLNADYSQAELRIAAWEANETTMLKLYRDGQDIHAYTAATDSSMSLEEFYNLPEQIREEKRSGAKVTNFGLIYEMWYKSYPAYAKSNYGIDVTEERAKVICDNFFKAYPLLKRWHYAKKEYAESHGYIRALHGAIRRLPDVKSREKWAVRQALRYSINSSVQRFASDMGLMAIQRIIRDCDPDILKGVGFVHDALVFEVKEGHEELAASAVKWYMENLPLEQWFGIKPPVPIVADIEIGKDMSSMKKFSVEAKKPEWFTTDKEVYRG